MPLEPESLNQLKLTLEQRKADVAELERQVAEGERTRLLGLHIELGLPSIEALIARLQAVATKRKAPNGYSASPEVKAKVRADLQSGVPPGEVMARHGVSSGVVGGIQATLGGPAAAAKPAKAAAGAKN